MVAEISASEVATLIAAVTAGIVSIIGAVASLKNSQQIKEVETLARVDGKSQGEKLDQIHTLTNSTLSAANKRIELLEGVVKDMIAEREKDKPPGDPANVLGDQTPEKALLEKPKPS